MRKVFLVLVCMLPSLPGCDRETKSDPTQGVETAAQSQNSKNDQSFGPTRDDGNKRPEKNNVGSVSASELKLIHWNIESGGADPGLIANQLAEFTESGCELFALSEVDAFEILENKFDGVGQQGQWQSIRGTSGGSGVRSSDCLMILFDSSRLKLIDSQEINRHGEFNLNTGRHRSPLVAQFLDKSSGKRFQLIQNHLARGNAKFRAEQAKGLREFGRDSTLAKICVGDFNFDFEFEPRQGNEGFVEMLRDNVWKWIEPEKLIDTNWYDPESDGIDNYPDSMLDFTFVCGEAKTWRVKSRVIVRDGDFPDNDKTSDHRPVEVVVGY